MRNKSASVDYMLNEKRKQVFTNLLRAICPSPLFPERAKEKEKSALGWGER